MEELLPRLRLIFGYGYKKRKKTRISSKYEEKRYIKRFLFIK